ncbi:FkbM family methyltransferase [Streptomyces canus]|uniref:FkbM family methyltransferase n=1 Tax=Streptomyces canus TaxID=58343 RepID=A0AAW8FG96_9ACTN|nr:FkbM family methyltransferase [Streptomyces canus]MDQ0763449.1 FkbM family methyltransferase [Streptomyces canus]MDQ0908095.1 FkbM family methyltransferase [Streptomyces canus]
MRIHQLDEANARMLAHAPSVRPVPTSDIIRVHRKKHPYRGYAEIDSPYCPPFVMFCVNDDAVALDTLWNGRFGYEPGSLATWARLAAKSTTIADVGAHVGYFSMIAALSAPQATVHSFEPVDQIHARLSVNVRSNGVQNVRLHQAGVSSAAGWAEISVRFSGNLLSTGSTLEHSTDDAQLKRIRLVSLDEVFADTKLDLIKIDVEGHEMSVLQGARQVLKRDRPSVLLEALAGAPLDPLLAEFDPLGYESHWIAELDGELVPSSAPRPPRTRNLLFLPRD